MPSPSPADPSAVSGLLLALLRGEMHLRVLRGLQNGALMTSELLLLWRGEDPEGCTEPSRQAQSGLSAGLCVGLWPGFGERC